MSDLAINYTLLSQWAPYSLNVASSFQMCWEIDVHLSTKAMVLKVNEDFLFECYQFNKVLSRKGCKNVTRSLLLNKRTKLQLWSRAKWRNWASMWSVTSPIETQLNWLTPFFYPSWCPLFPPTPSAPHLLPISSGPLFLRCLCGEETTNFPLAPVHN